MYGVEVRDHVMIAHSFSGEVFGPAQRMHGATFVIDVAFFREALDPDNIVVDIGRAHVALGAVLEPLRYRNLDEMDAFDGQNTTTEWMARHVYDGIKAKVDAGELGPHAGGLTKLRVTVGESHLARAWFEGPL